MRSETTKDIAGALPPAVYYTQPPLSKVIFHDDSTVEGREGMEQIMPYVTDDDGDSHVPSITFVDDSTIEIVAVGEVSDQYDTDSGSDIDDDDHDSYPPPHNNTHQVWSRHSGALIFALTCRVCTIGRAHIHYLVNDSVIQT